MSLKNLQINPYNIGALYENSLVIDNKKINVKTTGNEFTINYLGKNKNFVSILINDANNLHISDAILPFLTTLLSACKFTLDDVSIINTAKQTFTIDQLQNNLSCKYLILFGVATTTIDIPMVFPEYHIHQFNGIQCISSHTLEQIQHDAALKSQLWLCLKKVFAL